MIINDVDVFVEECMVSKDKETDVMIGMNDEVNLQRTEKQCIESDCYENVSEFN